MKYKIFPDGKGYIVGTLPSRPGAVSLSVEGKTIAGTIRLGGYTGQLCQGSCTIPAMYLTEGINQPVYIDRDGGRYPLEPFEYRAGNVTYAPSVPRDTVLALVNHAESAQRTMGVLEHRIEALEALSNPKILP